MVPSLGKMHGGIWEGWIYPAPSIYGSAQGQAGVLEHPGIMEGVPAHGIGL